MEQLTATVKQNADNAHHASKLAEDASGKASRGGQMVSGVVKTMGNISTSSKNLRDHRRHQQHCVPDQYPGA
jgi:methyl-accepting chemotaxis protein-3 (ribose and galactose sensor receptor)